MRLHDRYLFRELLTPLAYCVGAFLVFWTSIFFINQIETIHEKHLNLGDALAYCAASLPESLVFLLPMLLLLSLLYALTQHARHNEITALRATGVSLWRLCMPYFAVGLLATAANFALNEFAVPACDRWAQQILNRHTPKESNSKSAMRSARGFYNARAHRIWQFVSYDEHTTVMQNPTVAWTLPDGSWHELQAASAVRTNGVWTFFDVRPQVKFFRGQTDAVRLLATNVLAMPEFDETPERIRLLLKFADKQTLHGSSNADIPLSELWEFMRSNPGLSAEDAHAWATKFHERLAIPWTCFVVVLVAIPFGAQSGRRNLFVGVAGSIFIGFAYLVLQRVSLGLGMNGQLPGWLAAWLPNLIFAITGIVLTLRVR
jgi:lipopolysaccharide export system permease protein